LRVGGKGASITITLYPFCRAALESAEVLVSGVKMLYDAVYGN